MYKLIDQLHIKNFKSIVDLTLDLGRVNLFIGENGCGKSNILEAVAFASEETIDDTNTFPLFQKGVRIPEPELFRNCFDSSLGTKEIAINFSVDDELIETDYRHVVVAERDIQISEWIDENRGLVEDEVLRFHIMNPQFFKDVNPRDLINQFINGVEFVEDTPESFISKYGRLHTKCKYLFGTYLSKFIIYAPEISCLRKFDEEGQTKPLGFKGEGLFSLIKSLSKDNGSLQHIKEYLEAIEWFEDFSIPGDLMSNEHRIRIKDKYINSELVEFDQRSANEGFLFLLFYVVLFYSKRTPKFFAIDNIEASFNPKLCRKLITILVELAKKNDKQVLMTTHNPATLDGLNLNDPEQRLFVVRRNLDGHTIAKRITEKPKTSKQIKLSEMWTMGLLGGLPDNF